MNAQEEKQRLIDLTLKVEKPDYLDCYLDGQRSWTAETNDECEVYLEALHQAKQTALIIAKEKRILARKLGAYEIMNEYKQIINDLQKELE